MTSSGIGEVGGNRLAAAAQRPDRIDGGHGAGATVRIMHDDVRALARELQGHFAADAGAGAGDEGPLARQSSFGHGISVGHGCRIYQYRQ